MTSKFGAVEEANTVKAGCGIRYDPEQLGEDSGFDFSAAEQLRPTLLDDNNVEGLKVEPKPSRLRNTIVDS